MIKMSYDQLSNGHFQQSVQKLSASPMKNPGAFRVKHVIQGLQKALENMGERFRQDVLAKFAKGGADAGMVQGPNGLPFLPVEGLEEQAQLAYQNFGKTTFELPLKKLSAETLFSLNSWTAAELIALEPLFDEPVETSSLEADVGEVRELRGNSAPKDSQAQIQQ